VGFALLLAASAIAALNFYLSWLRYPLYRWKGGREGEYRWMSGFPIIGNVLCVGGWALGGASSAWWPLVILAFDTAGFPWLFITIAWHAVVGEPPSDPS